ncbi:GNAT family N-acetyltransferase [Neorhizobium sp. Rsf11]|uniref:GNAT family N-acetyltransferase n=2 Tax=Neorhizobium TaxID=1525371 RepID=A0ABV0M4Y8_9HYPH|nr:GNAT family N-acetyltransferase [Neorhizobium petrolearium]MCC2612997.1 GNAT family N-acetyltransferase [Neorhizobium petrolearium]WGI68099.1 GNAT family N-acetyltransferase [Neorhizobium petrolearium]
MTTDPIIRPLTLAETTTLVDWARSEGWNPGLADAPAFYAADPQGFIGCFVDDEMAAGISAVRYGADFGFIGLYIAHPDFRGKGYGRKVWDAGMAHLEGRTVGLDGVPEQQSNYRSMGFETAYQTLRWSGSLVGDAANEVVGITAALTTTVTAFDRKFFPSERDAFLAEWLKPPRLAKAVLKDSEIRGYAVGRKCHDGYKIGPLFAESMADAERLLRACAAEAGGALLHIDVPASQAEFSDHLAAYGFSKGFTTARMYRGKAPVVQMQGVFGITTLELG